MYGYLNLIIQSFIKENLGAEAWKSVISKSKCPANFEEQSQYKDDITQKLLDAAVQITGFKRDTFLSMLGEYYLDYIRKRGHDELLRNLGENMLAFLENLDYVHTYMMSDFPDVNMPSFRCETSSKEDYITLHYYSFRKGYYPMVMGILKAVSKVYYNTDLVIEVLSHSTEEVVKKKTQREHVVFGISPMRIAVSNHEAPPTFVAQTRKAGEKQILKTDVENVIAKLEQIRRTQGEEALPLNKAKAAQVKWKSVARVSMLRGGFVPDFPNTLSINGRTFCNAFPYHVVFNSSMEVMHCGIKIQQMMPSIRVQGCRVDLFFEVMHPHSMDFNYDNVRKFINTPFVMKARKIKLGKDWKSCPNLVFRGQMIHVDDQDLIIYICSPFVRSLQDLEERRMHIADIPIHDVTRDLLWMELFDRYRNSKSGGKECPTGTAPPRKYSNPVRNLGTSAYPVTNYQPFVVLKHGDGDNGHNHRPYSKHRVGGDEDPGTHPESTEDVEELRRELRRTQDELDDEKRKMQWLYRSLLPTSVADQVLRGKIPEAAEFQNVTALFCDIVAFSIITTRCKASDIVNLLTQLHLKFDHICNTHDTFRVEAIGDAYLVISGAPDQYSTHPERIANTALGMSMVAKEVGSPFDYGDRTKHVKIRIGIHTGPVICGVVGDRLPRYMAMGDTINMTSKMESHGVADKIQVSQNTYELLKKKPYRFEKRGKINIRGKGNMTTYVLLGNEQLSRSELTGRPGDDHQGVEVTFINEGTEEFPPHSTSTSGSRSPLITGNRVGPSQGQKLRLGDMSKKK